MDTDKWWDAYTKNMPDMGSSSSMANTCWALQQVCQSPLDKLLLIRIADGVAGSAFGRFRVEDLADFACCEPSDVKEAMWSLNASDLLNVSEEGDIFAVAMPWWKPGSIPSSVRGGTSARKLQYSKGIREMLMLAQGGACWYCGVSLVGVAGAKPHVEHQVPLCRGGTDEMDNLVMACGPCNTSKGPKTVDEYRSFVVRRDNLADGFRFYGEPTCP